MNALAFAAAAALTSIVSAFSSAAVSSVLYNQTLGTTPPAVVNSDPNFPFTNCLAAEGCFGNDGLVDAPGGNLPDTFTFTFTLTPADIILINSTPDFGLLTVVGARDIGHKTGAVASDWVVASVDGSPLGNFFQDAIDSCPAGERGTDYAQTLVCGPNFHTDVTATESLNISQSVLRAAAADGTIQIVLDPTDTVGRIKLFSVELAAVSQVGEPPVLLLVFFAGAAVLIGRRRLPRA